MPKRKAIESSDSANKISTEPTRGRQHGIKAGQKVFASKIQFFLFSIKNLTDFSRLKSTTIFLSYICLCS